jgi:hypothetical protein
VQILDERQHGHAGAAADPPRSDGWDDTDVLSQLTVTACVAYVDDSFQVLSDGQTHLTLELIAATPFVALETEEASAAGGRIPFSLTFRGPRDRVLPQRTYRFAHAALGEFPLFLVPIGPDSVGMRYEAAFM